MKILENVESYKVCEPLFEGVRVIMSYLGEKYSPQYIQGISGASFRVATGCPSRPTCCYMMWPTDLIKLLGYEYTEHPCVGPDNVSLIDEMILAVRNQIDLGRPSLVWHAMTTYEWDVVSGYDEVNGLFYGRGSYQGVDGADYHTEPWDHVKTAESFVEFVVINIGAKTGEFDFRQAEIDALHDAVAHARTVKDKPEDSGWYSYEGLQALQKWSEAYSNPGKDRDLADAYCFSVYHSTHGTAGGFLKEIAGHFPGTAEKLLLEAAEYMDEEAIAFKSCAPFLGWGSPWGVDENRSRAVAPILGKTADLYEKEIEKIELALENIG